MSAMRSKDELRRYIWDLMVNRGIAVFPLPPHGRIPNFRGATSSARNVRKLREYREARCVFVGPALMVAADVVARLALSPTQLPVGIVTGLIGGPYFLYLMRRKRRLGEM